MCAEEVCMHEYKTSGVQILIDLSPIYDSLQFNSKITIMTIFGRRTR